MVVIALFLIFIFIYWKSTKNYFKKLYGKKMFEQWGTRAFYWQSAMLICGGLTILTVFILKCGGATF